MEERIKKVKVTKENIITVATFTRGTKEVEDIVFETGTYMSKTIRRFKVVEEEKTYSDWMWTKPDNGRKYKVFLNRAKNDNIYDAWVQFGLDRESKRYLTPVLLKEDGTLESVNKITLNLQIGNEVVKHRLYFTQDEEEMWQRNMNEIAALLTGEKDLIWIEYTV
jgi:hypothetical protein